MSRNYKVSIAYKTDFVNGSEITKNGPCGPLWLSLKIYPELVEGLDLQFLKRFFFWSSAAFGFLNFEVHSGVVLEP